MFHPKFVLIQYELHIIVWFIKAISYFVLLRRIGISIIISIIIIIIIIIITIITIVIVIIIVIIIIIIIICFLPVEKYSDEIIAGVWQGEVNFEII